MGKRKSKEQRGKPSAPAMPVDPSAVPAPSVTAEGQDAEEVSEDGEGSESDVGEATEPEADVPLSPEGTAPPDPADAPPPAEDGANEPTDGAADPPPPPDPAASGDADLSVVVESSGVAVETPSLVVSSPPPQTHVAEEARTPDELAPAATEADPLDVPASVAADSPPEPAPLPATGLVRCRALTTVAVKVAFNEAEEPVRRVREGHTCLVGASFFEAHKDLFERL